MVPKNILEKLDETQISFMEQFFKKCDESFFKNVMLKSFPKNHKLMVTDDDCTYVCVLLKGRLQAVEERVADQPYNFLELVAIEIVGDYELFTGEKGRLVTLVTAERSLCLMIPSNTYINWIKKDAHALTIRIQMLIRQTVDQTTFERYNFFQDNHTRFLLYLVGECEKKKPVQFPVKIQHTRPEISQKMGCSIRTVNRAVLWAQEQKLISLKRGKIYISHDQYIVLKQETGV